MSPRALRHLRDELRLVWWPLGHCPLRDIWTVNLLLAAGALRPVRGALP